MMKRTIVGFLKFLFCLAGVLPSVGRFHSMRLKFFSS